MRLKVDYSFLKECIKQRKCFAAFSLPELNQFQLILPKNGTIKKLTKFDDISNEQGFIFAPFNINNHPAFLFENDLVLNQNDLIALDFDNNNFLKSAFSTIEQKEIDKQDYQEAFTIFQKNLSGGKIDKLVLSRLMNIKKPKKFHIVDLFEILVQSYPEAYNTLVFTEEKGVWLGASPELLLKANKTTAKTVALAGTTDLSNNRIEDVQWTSKEIIEQQYVTDYILNILEKYYDKGDILYKTHTSKAAGLAHIKTEFDFPSNNILNNLGAFLNEIHPTPAVCGLPKEDALQIIDDTEKHDREYYSGFLGTLNIRDESNLFVNLRCLKENKNSLSLFVGGGITRESIAEAEWEETLSKAQTLLRKIDDLK